MLSYLDLWQPLYFGIFKPIIMIKNTDLEITLDKYAETFMESIEENAVAYKIIGSGTHESPMWFQYRGIEDGFLMFKSSQVPDRLWFKVRIDEGDLSYLRGESDFIYDYFRTLKYNYLSEMHPTVYKELK